MYKLFCLFTLIVLVQLSVAQTLQLPPRPSGGLTRDQIVQFLTVLSRDAREDTLFEWITKGKVPDFIRTLVPVTSSATIGGVLYSVTYYVTPEYLAVGPDERYFLTPMTPLLAQRLCDTLQCTLPTRKMVNDIYAAARLKLAPAPIAPSAAMITVPVFAQHDSMVWAQRSPQIGTLPLGTLVGGTHKDVVISNKITNDLKAGVPKPVVIYGWHQLNGVPIQPLYNGHEETYADYSHGIRLVQQAVQLNGSPTTISAILKDPNLAPILSDEGRIPFPRYGNPPTGVRDENDFEPERSALFQNYPNPFNPKTSVKWQVASGGEAGTGVLGLGASVKLSVYDLLGREVKVLVNERRAPGTYEVSFDGNGMAGGVYIYRMTAGTFVQTRKMVLLK